MRKRFRKRKFHNEEVQLQITSMADIFIIILVFLLKTFTISVSSITPSNDVALPESNHLEEFADSMKIEISPTSVIVDDQPVVTLENFKFKHEDLDGNGTPKPLNKALKKEKDRQIASQPVPEDDGDSTKKVDQKPKEKLLVLADQKTPYSTLKPVLDAAANEGFLEFKLVLVEDQ